ncbi:MAG: metallophosphoesterase [Alphaproteobacteria bacterium]|nr:metallophosphoesterase [Alphaproteobacteria bacterium]
MRASVPFLAFALACTSSTPSTDDTDGDGDSDVLTGCAIPEVDTDGEDPLVDDRLLRWPYTSHVTDEAVTVQWGLPPGVTGKLEWGTGPGFGEVSDATLSELDQLVSPIQLHQVRLTGLTPDTQYCYRITVDGEDVSGPLALHTAPSKDSTEPIRFLVMGDYGAGIGFATLVYQQIKPYFDDIDFWLTTGDNAYTSGTAQQWQTNVFWFYRDLLRRAPYFPAPGNHDYGSPLGLTPTLESIDLPPQAYRDDDKGKYYSFDWGPVHFTVLDSEISVNEITPDVEDDDMAEWFADDLAANQDRPWRFGAWHHPMYYTEPKRSAKREMVDYIRPLVESQGVEVALAGHSHLYEVYQHIKDDQKVDWGTTYVTTGGGGASADDIDGEDHAKELALRTFGQSVNHFMLFEVDLCTVKARAIDLQGAEIHAWTLERPDCP